MNTQSWLHPDWPAPANIHAATTLRTGGVSQGLYDSLNLALHVGDDPQCVKQNREFIQHQLALPCEPFWLSQTHSNQAIKAEAGSTQAQADSSYTDQSGIVCAVMTADCLPLLVCSRDGNEVAAIHAGWRGLLAGIIDNTLKALQNNDVLVWLGPAIGPNTFEVGDDVYNGFVEKDPDNAAAFKPHGKGHWLANIYRLAETNLNRLGINHIYGGNFCTYTEKERFYSYRRDNATGRMASLIWRD